MLSMAVHRGLPVLLPTSSTAKPDKNLILSVTIKKDGIIYLDKDEVSIVNLGESLKRRAKNGRDTGVLLFADQSLPYQKLFRVLDQIRMAGLWKISLQAEAE